MNSVVRKTLQSFALIALAAGICLPAAAQDTATQPAHREAKAKATKSGKTSARSGRKAPVTGKISINNASAQELTRLPLLRPAAWPDSSGGRAAAASSPAWPHTACATIEPCRSHCCCYSWQPCSAGRTCSWSSVGIYRLQLCSETVR